jgi:protein TonB
VVETGSRAALVDVVLGARSSGQRRRVLAAALVTIAVHGSLLLWAKRHRSHSEGSPPAVHAAPAPEPYVVDLAQPPPPEKPRAPDRPAKQPPPPRLPPSPRSRAEPSRPASAQAGAIVAQEPDPSAPLDLTGETLVTGTANAYAGGLTGSKGASTVAVRTAPGDPRSAPGARLVGRDRSRAVSLEDQNWSCPWPREGAAEQIDEQTVVIRVLVRPDGSAESAEVLSDPGHDFGQAAAACAMRTRFTPAHDRDGEPMRARSPPIRVRFTR